MVNFTDKLAKATQKNQSLLCIGLDPDQERLPPGVTVLEFNRAIIDATSDQKLRAYYLTLVRFY